MKQVFTFLAAVLLTASVFAQSPEKMSYQAVIRNSSDQLVTVQSVGMQISILQGSASGTAVYVETQTPTTNANGLVSLEIGTGTVVSGNFTTIDWANGTYFIKTETDLTGGANYTITGTSQLLSVPYALHAKTAETLSGGITETDPIFGASVASGITATDTTNWNNKQEQLIAGTGINIVGNTISATPLAIGDSYQGGIIFWIDASGQHGLIAATADQSAGVRWYAEIYMNTVAYADGVGAGKANTAIIIAKQGYGDGGTYAARICNEYQSGGYGDWYLPSEYELDRLYQQKTAVGGFATGYYWSSTECISSETWGVWFGSGLKQTKVKYYASGAVRAIRAF
jgi:hypothetical protein